MNKSVNNCYKILLYLIITILAGLIIVIFIENERYVRTQEFDCDYFNNSYNITQFELDDMPFIEEIITANGDAVYISDNEYNDLINFIEKHGSGIIFNKKCYDIQIRMS